MERQSKSIRGQLSNGTQKKKWPFGEERINEEGKCGIEKQKAANAIVACWVSSKNPIHSWVAAASERTSTVLMLASCMALAPNPHRHTRLIDSNADEKTKQIKVVDLPRVESTVGMMVAGDEILKSAFPASESITNKNKQKQTKTNTWVSTIINGYKRLKRLNRGCETMDSNSKKAAEDKTETNNNKQEKKNNGKSYLMFGRPSIQYELLHWTWKKSVWRKRREKILTSTVGSVYKGRTTYKRWDSSEHLRTTEADGTRPMLMLTDIHAAAWLD